MVKFTTANVDDQKVLDQFLDRFNYSIVLADAGYISPKLQKKAAKGRNVVLTSVRKNMKKLATPLQIFLLNMRGRIESVFSVLKERLGLSSYPQTVIPNLPSCRKAGLVTFCQRP